MKILQDRAEDLAAAEAEEASGAAEALAEAAVEAAASAVEAASTEDTTVAFTADPLIITIITAAFGFSGPGTITTVAAITEAVASAAFLA
jgi:hypothetical protein